MEMIEAFISFISLVSLIVILLEARRAGGLRRRLPVALWAVSLVLLALLALVRVWANLDVWSDVRILMGTVSVGNFLFGAGLLVRWLVWRPAVGG
jgi:predicted neutral ceramidase superfamily lipid hydrolase